MTEHGEFEQGEAERLFNLVSQDPQEALQLLRDLEKKFFDDQIFQWNRAGLLIDIGTILDERTLIEEGVDNYQSSYCQILPEWIAVTSYNLANGYSALHQFDMKQPNATFNPDCLELSKAKEMYRQALSKESSIDRETRVMLHVNFGNLLDQLGRFLEAISEYHIATNLDPMHAMANGNLGLTLVRHASIATDPSFLRMAQVALKRSLEADHLEQLGEGHARSRFEAAYEGVSELRSRFGASQHDNQGGTTQFRKSAEGDYIWFCSEHVLYLNFCIDQQSCLTAPYDSASFSMTTAIDDDTTFPRLARVVNEMKESYATARLLLYEACDPFVDFESIDLATHYVDNLDYAVYGVRVGKLKRAFETAYNILDKIALFLNDYFNLGLAERRVGFATIWKPKKGQTIRQEFLTTGNFNVFALYDLSLDLERGGAYYRLRQRRQYLTHRYLVPHAESTNWNTDADGDDYHVAYSSLKADTIRILQIVRCAVVYLIALIDTEENSRQGSRGDGFSLPIWVPRYVPTDLPPD